MFDLTPKPKPIKLIPIAEELAPYLYGDAEPQSFAAIGGVVDAESLLVEFPAFKGQDPQLMTLQSALDIIAQVIPQEQI